MASPARITDGVAGLLAAVLAASVCAPPVAAHDMPRTAVRELVRLQGYFLEAGAQAGGETLDVEVQGQVRPFRLVDRQVFIAVAAAGRPAEAEPARLTLQGTRELLARAAQARPGTRVTLLGERRPGSSEIFLAAVDLCPEPPVE